MLFHRVLLITGNTSFFTYIWSAHLIFNLFKRHLVLREIQEVRRNTIYSLAGTCSIAYIIFFSKTVKYLRIFVSLFITYICCSKLKCIFTYFYISCRRKADVFAYHIIRMWFVSLLRILLFPVQFILLLRI